MIRNFEGTVPSVGKETFVAETAALIGDVEVGARSSIWYGAVLRGDVFHIRVGDATSIQDNTVVHVTSGSHPALIGSRVTVGHAAIVHGCTIADDVLVGMGAVIMDRAHIGSHCIVGAGALVTPGTIVEEGNLVVGSPARVKRPLTDAERAWIAASAKHYSDLAKRYLASE